MSRVDRIIAWIDGLNNLMLRRALLRSWMLVLGMLCIPVARRLTVIPVSGPDFILGVVSGTMCGVLTATWMYLICSPSLIGIERGVDMLRDALEQESTDDLVKRWADSRVSVREQIAQILRLRDDPEAQSFLFGEARSIAPDLIDRRRHRREMKNIQERAVTRMFTRIGCPIGVLFFASILLMLAGSYMQIEGRADLAVALQNLGRASLWVCLVAPVLLGWGLARSGAMKFVKPQFSTDAQLFEAWKEGHDAALSRLLTPGFRTTDPAVREFVAKLNLGAQPVKSGAGSLWPLWRPTDNLDRLLSD